MKPNKFNTMKKSILLLTFAILVLPFTAMAQSDIFEKYSDNPEVTYVSIKPKMFQMLAKMDINSDDPESQEYIDMVNSITSFKTLVTDNKAISADMVSWAKQKTSKLEELMEVKDDGVEMKFYVKEGNDPNYVKELLMYVDGVNNAIKTGVEVNGKKREINTVLVSLTGNINLNQISKLTKKMNIPGGDKLDKKD